MIPNQIRSWNSLINLMGLFSSSDTQDVDLDAILGELCALESQYKDVADSSPRNSSNGTFALRRSLVSFLPTYVRRFTILWLAREACRNAFFPSILSKDICRFVNMSADVYLEAQLSQFWLGPIVSSVWSIAFEWIQKKFFAQRARKAGFRRCAWSSDEICINI